MDLFIPTLGKMVYLVAFILIGYLLARFGAIKTEAAGMLSKLENIVFIPALMISTFMSDFSVSELKSSWKLVLFSIAIEMVFLPLSLWVGRKCSKDPSEQKILAYGLAFSNFGYMGHAVVQAIFAQYFREYVLFTLPLYVIIYVWAVPALLMPNEQKQGWKKKVAAVFNGKVIGMLVGMAIGLLRSSFTDLIPLVAEGGVPDTVGAALINSVFSVIKTAGDCMSPVAMLLMGITIASIDLSKVFRAWDIYLVTFLRLAVYPLVGFGILVFLDIPDVYKLCAVCALAMPLGLSNVVIPAAYGMDTTKAAAMALVSHLISIATIPLMFMLLRMTVMT